MKAFIYGQESKYETLTASLKQEGIEMQKLEYDFYTTGDLGINEEIDLAIVDSRSENSYQAYQCIRKNWDIPILLVIDSRWTNWKDLRPIDADGYIPDVNKGSELAARFRAITRRLFLRDKIQEKTPEEKTIPELKAVKDIY